VGFLDRMKGAQEAVSGAGGLKGMMGQAMPGGGDMAKAQLAQKLAASGVQASGTVTALQATGNSDFGGGQEQQVSVNITPTGGEPYDTTLIQSFQPSALETLAVGTTVSVKYDPDNPSAALIYSWG
jgi:hypothetical protein